MRTELSGLHTKRLLLALRLAAPEALHKLLALEQEQQARVLEPHKAHIENLLMSAICNSTTSVPQASKQGSAYLEDVGVYAVCQAHSFTHVTATDQRPSADTRLSNLKISSACI